MSIKLTEDQINELAALIEERLAGRYAPAELVPKVQRLEGWKRAFENDALLGKMQYGAQWVDAMTGVRDGTITGEKFASTITISSRFTTSETAPNMELNANGLFAYDNLGFESVAIRKNGTFRFGHPTIDQYAIKWENGTLSVGAATITNLTIAQIGGGVIGGAYDTGTGTAKMRLSTAGIEAWNSSNQRLVHIANTGSFRFGHPTNDAQAIWWDGTQLIVPAATIQNLTIANIGSGLATGTYTFGSTNNARITLSPSGITLYSGPTTIRGFIGTNGTGYLGGSDSNSAAIVWDTTQAYIRGQLLAAGSVSGTAIANATITDANIANGTITSAKIASLSADKITTGTLTGQFINIGSGGRLTWNGGNSYLDATTMLFGQQTFEQSHIIFQRSGSSAQCGFRGLDVSTTVSLEAYQTWGSASKRQTFYRSTGAGLYSFVQTEVYEPSYGTISERIGYDYITNALYYSVWSGSWAFTARDTGYHFKLNDGAGATQLAVYNSSNVRKFAVASNGEILVSANDIYVAGAPTTSIIGKLRVLRTSDGNPLGWIPIYAYS